jgi:hypothetical protein
VSVLSCQFRSATETSTRDEIVLNCFDRGRGFRRVVRWGLGGASQFSCTRADAQTGRKIASYSDPTGLGTSFACYSANEGVFTFLNLGEGNALEVIRAEAQ